METTNKIFRIFLSAMVLVIISGVMSGLINIGIMTDTIKVFEDNSWAIGEYPYIVHGCGEGLCGEFSIYVFDELLVIG